MEDTPVKYEIQEYRISVVYSKCASVCINHVRFPLMLKDRVALPTVNYGEPQTAYPTCNYFVSVSFIADLISL